MINAVLPMGNIITSGQQVVENQRAEALEELLEELTNAIPKDKILAESNDRYDKRVDQLEKIDNS